jgi:release factor glutamine methyltransferase
MPASGNNQATLGAARSWAARKLESAGIAHPVLTADLLLGHAVGWSRERVLSHREDILPDRSRRRLKALVHRCATGEPLQYLTGGQEFYGLYFRVLPTVLIPRPETEILVEKTVALARQCQTENCRFLDIGTGSGCIAVAVACHHRQSRGWAVDISREALRTARENAARHGVLHRIQFIQSDLSDCFAGKSRFDFILSNPPYIARREYDSLPVSIRCHEPRLALYGGESGLDYYRRLLPMAFPQLKPGGYLLLELGAGQSEPVIRIAGQTGFLQKEIIPDLRGIPRCLIVQKTTGEHDG